MRNAQPATVSAYAPPELRLASRARTITVSTAPDPGALEEAYRRGYEDGITARDADGERQRDDAVAALGATLQGLSTVADEIRGRLTSNLPALALAAARHLMQRELDADPEVMRSLVERALAATPLSGQVTVRVHPADFAALGDVTAFTPPAGSSFELVWAADPAILRGGCVVETPASVVDGRVDEALLDLFERLTRD